MAVAFFIVGILFWGGFNTALELTNTESFCISCHEMRDNVYREYVQSPHFHNRTGVRASCPDCHVPRGWGHMVWRKIRATNELVHSLRGSIATRELFLAKRLELARHVWRDMTDTDSRECRNCHDYTAMLPAAQGADIAARHLRAQREGKTCISCHIGIAHQLPGDFIEQEHQRFRDTGRACADCHVGMPPPVEQQQWGW